MNERGEATEGDLRARIVWHIQEAQRACSVGPGCSDANPDGTCCEAICWVEFDVQEQLMVMPGKRRVSA